jgi:hypothetical protein
MQRRSFLAALVLVAAFSNPKAQVSCTDSVTFSKMGTPRVNGAICYGDTIRVYGKFWGCGALTIFIHGTPYPDPCQFCPCDTSPTTCNVAQGFFITAQLSVYYKPWSWYFYTNYLSFYNNPPPPLLRDTLPGNLNDSCSYVNLAIDTLLPLLRDSLFNFQIEYEDSTGTLKKVMYSSKFHILPANSAQLTRVNINSHRTLFYIADHTQSKYLANGRLFTGNFSSCSFTKQKSYLLVR